MDDDELAHAWESFATALREVPEQRENRRHAANLMRGTCLADFGASHEMNAQIQQELLRQHEMMRHISHNPYVRGIQPRIFGFGIMI